MDIGLEYGNATLQWGGGPIQQIYHAGKALNKIPATMFCWYVQCTYVGTMLFSIFFCFVPTD